jgi:IS5 family transposase
MKRITEIAGAVGTQLRDRSRAVKLRTIEIARIARAKGPVNYERLKRVYWHLLTSTSRVVRQARRFCQEISDGTKRSRNILKQLALEGLREDLEEMSALVRRVIHQTRQRIFHGNTRTEGKILSLFEPSTEIIRKGKAGKPNEFGKVLRLQEAENQIIVDYEVYARRPSDRDLLVPSVESHRAKLGRAPRLLAADAGFFSAKNEAAARAMGVKRVCIPHRSTKSVERRQEQKKRWFRTAKSGAPDPRGESAWSSAGTASVAADTRASAGCNVGPASV